jgi:hypothetical protein
LKLTFTTVLPSGGMVTAPAVVENAGSSNENSSTTSADVPWFCTVSARSRGEPMNVLSNGSESGATATSGTPITCSSDAMSYCGTTGSLLSKRTVPS